MSSFYLTLSSDCKATGQQPGDFTHELTGILDFTKEQWEMALVEMTYTGQEFDTIPEHEAFISISTREIMYYDADYAVFWFHTADLWIKIRHKNTETQTYFKSENIRIPQLHYTWSFFKSSLIEAFSIYSELVSCSFHDNDKMLHIRVPYEIENKLDITIEFSPNFSKILNSYTNRDISHKITTGGEIVYQIKIRPLLVYIPDLSDTILNPTCKDSDLRVLYGNTTLFNLTRQFWTIETLKCAFEYITTYLREDGKYATDLDSIELVDSDGIAKTFAILLITKSRVMLGREVYPAEIKFGSGTAILHLETIRNVDTSKSQLHGEGHEVYRTYTKFSYALCQKPDDTRYNSYTVTMPLSKTKFSTLDGLVTEFNQTCQNIINEIASVLNTKVPQPNPFSKKDNNTASFNEYKNYNVKCSNYINNRLNLTTASDGFLKTQIGSKVVESSLYTRTHFYIHCDCVRGHYVNNMNSSLIRTVANSAPIGEKHTVSMSYLQYHPIIRDYVAYINMYITDYILQGTSKFLNTVVYTLHFRKCLR